MTATSIAPLRGPDPERFRTQVYGARWYHDPLPADDTWPKTTDQWPSVTTVKKGWSKPFRKKLPTGETVPLDAYWAATFTVERLGAINALATDPNAAIALICGAGSRTLHAAADRGTGVHRVLENIAATGIVPDPILVDPAVQPYVPACAAFINDWQPEWIATEFVVINRTLGFGGTGDAIIAINLPGVGRYICVSDWKSRGGQHGCYEEEIAQIGGYSLADYIIVEGPDQRPVRMPIPELDGGLVVSLNETSYEAYPVDLDKAQTAFRAMYESWRGQRDGQKAARKARQQPLIPAALPPAPDPAPAESDRTAWIRDRVAVILAAGHEAELAAIWLTDQVPAPLPAKLHDDQINVLAVWCDQIEACHGIPFGTTDPLYAAFQPPPEPPEVTHSPQDASVIVDDMARQLVLDAKAILDQFDPPEQAALIHAAGIAPQATMTTDWVRNLQALADEVALEGGGVVFDYGSDGPTITPTGQAEARMVAAAATRGEARDRAARLAKQAGRIAPRSLDQAATNPLLVALVAAGHGTPNNKENT